MLDSYSNNQKLSQKKAKNKAIEIAKQACGSDDKDKWNTGGWPSNTGQKISASEITNINDLHQILEEYGPVYAYYSNDESAHLIVIMGIDLYRGVVYTNNPWGVRGSQSFDDFLNSVANHWWKKKNTYKLKNIYTVE